MGQYAAQFDTDPRARFRTHHSSHLVSLATRSERELVNTATATRSATKEKERGETHGSEVVQ